MYFFFVNRNDNNDCRQSNGDRIGENLFIIMILRFVRFVFATNDKMSNGGIDSFSILSHQTLILSHSNNVVKVSLAIENVFKKKKQQQNHSNSKEIKLKFNQIDAFSKQIIVCINNFSINSYLTLTVVRFAYFQFCFRAHTHTFQ